MAEKTTSKKKPTAAAKAELKAALADVQKEAAAPTEADLRPDDRIEQRAVTQVVAVAEGLTVDGVISEISSLKASVGRSLADIAERLEGEVERYRQVRRAIQAKEKELSEIYEVQKQMISLSALIEAQQARREAFDAEMAQRKDELEREIVATRAAWQQEETSRQAEIKERELAEQKRREREKEEYRYAFAREQQIAKDQFADEKARIERDLAMRRQELERQLGEREQAIAAREAELAQLRQRAERAPAELEAAVAKAAKEASARAAAESQVREQMLQQQFQGEKNVLTTRIAALEQAVKEQAAQLAAMTTKLEKAYAQVQDVAVRAIEGSANTKTLASLQQMLADQVRKGGGEK